MTLRRLTSEVDGHPCAHLEIAGVRHYVRRHNGIPQPALCVQSVPLSTCLPNWRPLGSLLTRFEVAFGYPTTPKSVRRSEVTLTDLPARLTNSQLNRNFV